MRRIFTTEFSGTLLLAALLFCPPAQAYKASAEVEALPVCPGGSGDPKPKVVPDEMQPTVYDDGKSCPGNCQEPHVVFYPTHNGTDRAHEPRLSKPKAQPPVYAKCVKGQKCRICFKANAECMILKYEGAGPPHGRFDFPVIFYKKYCPRSGLPKALEKLCAYFKKQTDAYAGKVYCLSTPNHPDCSYLMEKANEEKARDMKEYDACKSMGLAAYNATKPPEQRRWENCNYSDIKPFFKSSSKGVACKRSWHMLLPGACPPGTYVGSYGLNCCGGDVLWRATLGADCQWFFPKPNQSK